MKTASTILLISSGAAALAAIWTPIGSWWQWTITALILVLAGAGLGGTAAMPKHYAKGGHIGPQRGGDSTAVELRSGRIEQSTGDPDLDQNINTRPTYGKPSKENDK